jgi:signal transduction histidine kinase
MASPRATQLTPINAGQSGAPRAISATIRSMQIGLHLITAALLAVAVARAYSDGVSVGPVIAGALVFSLWYAGGIVLATRVHGRALPAWWLTGLAVIWVGTVAFSAEFIWLAFSLWLLAGYILRWRVAVLFATVTFLVVAAAPILQFGTTSYANIIGPLLGGTFALTISRGYVELVNDLRERHRLVESLVQAQAEMAELQEELAKTQRSSGAKAERTRISRDIHDTVAQGLSSISLLATAATGGGQGEGPPDAGGQGDTRPEAGGQGDGEQRETMTRALRQIDALARDNLVDVRRIVAALAPAELDESALAGALQRMLDRLAEEGGLVTELHVDDDLPTLPTTVEVALLRTAQSALANVRQHAKARRVVMNLVGAGDSVRLDIVDDGHGFDLTTWGSRVRRGAAAEAAVAGKAVAGAPAAEAAVAGKAAASGAAAGGYGLHAMRSRLRELGGGLDIESTLGEGVALSAYVPLAAQPRRA